MNKTILIGIIAAIIVIGAGLAISLSQNIITVGNNLSNNDSKPVEGKNIVIHLQDGIGANSKP